MLSFASVAEPSSSRRKTRTDSPRWPRLIALTAALAALLIVATGVTVWHQDSPGTVCPICYAAHSPALRSASTSAVSAPLVVAWAVIETLYLDHADAESLQWPPRGPPSA
jgi:hypothetical protein